MVGYADKTIYAMLSPKAKKQSCLLKSFSRILQFNNVPLNFLSEFKYVGPDWFVLFFFDGDNIKREIRKHSRGAMLLLSDSVNIQLVLNSNFSKRFVCA